MTMFEIYKSRKQNLVLRIKESKSLYETGSVISELFETMQYQYLADNKDRVFAEKVNDLISFAKTNFPLLESVSKYKLWENAEGKEPKKKSLMPGFIALLAGLALIFVPLGYYMFIKNIKFADIRTYMLSILAGCFVILVSGFMLFFRRKVKNKATVEIYADAEDMANRLEEVVKTIDNLLEKEKEYIANWKKQVETSINEEEAQLFAYLLEAKLSADGEYALEQTAEVEHYLAKQDVLIVNYSKGKEKYFQFLTGDEEKTIRPALVRGGEVLHTGLAQIVSDQ